MTASYFRSTIGRKQIVALTGLGLSVFVLLHALGNYLIFFGPEAYNMYSHKLVSNPLIYLAEGGLVVMFIVHMILAVKLSFENTVARPQGYAVSAAGEKATSLVTKTMRHQGIVILVFVVLHLIGFKFGTYYETSYDGVVVRDIFKLVVEVFQNPGAVLWYCIAVGVLGFHLSHGVSSAIQSLGCHHPIHTPKVKLIGVFYGVLVAGSFILQPIYVFLFYKG